MENRPGPFVGSMIAWNGSGEGLLSLRGKAPADLRPHILAAADWFLICGWFQFSDINLDNVWIRNSKAAKKVNLASVT